MKTAGPYNLIKLIATGGMAEVFLGLHQTSKAHCAVKRILPHLTRDPKFVELFVQEAELASLFEHPNIVEIHELGHDEQGHYIAMEYVHGLTLRQLLSANPALPEKMAAHIVWSVLQALHYAHTFCDEQGQPLGLIHRDVSPHNIIIGIDGRVKLLDFGIAKATGRLRHTHSTTLKGKFAYMSPEQAEQDSGIDARSDVFSCGVVLFEALTGKKPFDGETDASVLLSLMNDPAPRTRSIKPDAAEHLVAIADRALQKETGRRFSTARDMAGELKEYLGDDSEDALQAELSKVVRDTGEVHAFVPQPMDDSLTPTARVTHQSGSAGNQLRVAVAVVVCVGSVTYFMLHSQTPASPHPTQPALVPQQTPQPPMLEPMDFAVQNPTPAPTPTVEKAKRSPKRSNLGALRFEIVPDIEIRVDGRLIDRKQEMKLKSGVHTVRMSNRNLGIQFKQQIRIARGQTKLIRKTFQQGTLKVHLRPYGKVFVNGVSKGVSPIGEVSLYEGEHIVRAEWDGTQKTKKVIVKPGKLTKLKMFQD